MKTVIYPGSFDPITLGHLNLIKRVSKIFDRVIVCVMVNVSKKTLFTLEERMEQVRLVTKRFPNVEVDCSEELTAAYAKRVGATVIVRGLRALSDYERECQIALVNKKFNPDLETIFLASSEKYMYHSSSAVRELAAFGADLSEFAPREIIKDIEAKYKDRINTGGK